MRESPLGVFKKGGPTRGRVDKAHMRKKVGNLLLGTVGNIVGFFPEIIARWIPRREMTSIVENFKNLFLYRMGKGDKMERTVKQGI